jgi:hypothetical protein
MPILVYSTLQGFIDLLEEAIAGGVTVSPDDWGRLRRAFALLFYVLRQGTVDATALDAPLPHMPPPRARDDQHSALSRWTRGHHMFMVVIQGLVSIFNRFEREAECGRSSDAVPWLRAATCLMAAAGVALRFTGDFHYSDYDREVRPMLMPPIAPEGLTGQHWRDHEYLIRLLTKMRPLFVSLGDALREPLRQFHDALRVAYESHKAVCATFVGTAQPSLLMAARTGRSAVGTLDHFMRVRLNLVEE